MIDELGVERARSMGNFVPFAGATDGNGDAPPDWIDFRASAARAARRYDLGEKVETCSGCGTELDVDQVVHSPRCAGHELVAEASAPVEASTPAATFDAAKLLTALATAARELAELGATDPAIAVHFQNVCAAALETIKETPADA